MAKRLQKYCQDYFTRTVQHDITPDFCVLIDSVWVTITLLPYQYNS